MIRIITLLLLAFFTSTLFAGQGGPDAYGYIWKDSNEPDGPVYAWQDITSIGTLVSGLADDNSVGPIVMQTSFQYYWYTRKFIWVGSNGYIAFNSGNIASPFPTIPTSGGTNDYIAAMMSDLTFLGAGNPAQCYIYDDGLITTVSYINVPFWSATAPNNFEGSNTFQIILDTNDSTITVQYQAQTGLTQNTDLKLGIESVAGSIGLQHSANVYPVANYAIRYYQPPVGLLDISDATITYNTAVGSGGQFLSRGGSQFPLSTVIGNIGNVDVADFLTTGDVLNAAGAVVVTNQQSVGYMAPYGDTLITYQNAFDPTTAGTYRFRTTISGVMDELVTLNNTQIQELVVLDTTVTTHDLEYHGNADDGLGLGWSGGNGGVGVHLIPPYYPAYATATTVRIAANATLAAFTMMVFADDGPDNTPGTLLDSVYMSGANAAAGNHVVPLSSPLTIADGGVYVQWYMEGEGVNIAQDISPPFSLQTYEVLGGTWAEFRDRENIDFFIGLRLEQVPVYDIGCSGFFGVAAMDDIGSPLAVRAFVHNYGNAAITNFPLSYRFGTDPVFTQTYTGAAIAPGAETLVTFTQQFIPTMDGQGDLCAWTAEPTDVISNNDTLCLTVSTWIGIEELPILTATVGPNPANEFVRISGLPIGSYSMELHDMQGKLIDLERLNVAHEGVHISVADVRSGFYVLHMRSEEGSFRTLLSIER
ncbi:MAG: T9SS type A sorting domain-containing protein [Flavobacteriales bacterium]|nr:T9SS type A sorting domain-containing protein [Flavobacteriales bacterium]MBK6946192.1 T9SS type A sorting domain-containing protein [Flavobacteriales bacterium]MBK7238855.1 T9SS type A sorting domain-containing protein [Flavobacteriales bacterium]MBK9537020.1 T9SS type A sorting domain-containing protein [Flavobacteriales bacterium]MBP9139147.1 T9SS type A sorting domain-containing protein [Flavobacteriales bacterium]